MTRRSGSKPGADPSVPEWGDAPLDNLLDWISSHAGAWDVSLVQDIRNRAAMSLGSAPQDADRLSRALADRALSSAHTSFDARAWVHRARAEACLFTGALGHADAHYRKAVLAARRAKDGDHLGQILVGWIGVLSWRGKTREARAAAGEAERALQRANDTAYLAKLYMNVGNSDYHRERYAEALTTYRKAVDAFTAAGIRDASWGGLLVNLGVACTHEGRFDQAVDYLERAASEADEMKLDLLAAHARFNRAHVDRLRGDYRATLERLRGCEHAFDELDAADMSAAVRLTRAEIYLELGMPADAAREAEAARASFLESGMELDAELARLPLAQAELRSGATARARTTLSAALDAFKAHRLWPRLAAGRVLLAETELLAGDLTGASRSAAAALRLLETKNLAWATARARRVLAEIHLRAHRFKRAEDQVGRALKLARSLPPGDRAALYDVGARVAVADGRTRTARQRFQRAIDAIETQQRLTPGAAYRSLAFEDFAMTYRRAVEFEVNARSEPLAHLWPLVEASRARRFRERRQGEGAGAHLGDDKAQLRHLLRRLETHQLTGADPDVVRSLSRDIAALEQRIGLAFRESDESTLESRALSVEEVGRRLPANGALVSYFVVPSGVLALVVTPDAKHVLRLPATSDEISSHVTRVRHHLDTMSTQAASRNTNVAFMRRATDAALRSLHDALLAPVLAAIEEPRTLFVVPHDVLHHVPFECLTDGEAYLSDRMDIARLPSASAIAERPPRVATARVCVAGTVTHGPAAVGSELAAVERACPNAEVLRDPRADELLERLRTVDVLHLAAHGTFRGDNAMFSHIATVDGGLFVADLLDSETRADLVVLSACNSGTVFPGSGDDLSGVAHAFLAAGAHHLVASHWRVHDEATADLMRAFYESLAAGPSAGDPAASMGIARRTIRDRWDHPFYWGSFGVHVAAGSVHG
jgi:CHAT domain-containing protein